MVPQPFRQEDRHARVVLGRAVQQLALQDLRKMEDRAHPLHKEQHRNDILNEILAEFRAKRVSQEKELRQPASQEHIRESFGASAATSGQSLARGTKGRVAARRSQQSCRRSSGRPAAGPAVRCQPAADRGLDVVSLYAVLQSFFDESGFCTATERRVLKAGWFWDRKYTYPLHEAVRLGDAAAVHALLWAGADAEQPNSEGWSASELAKQLLSSHTHPRVFAALAESQSF